MKYCSRAGLALLLLVVSSFPAYALDPTRSLTQSIHRIWQVQQGLPQAWVYSVAQTSDGYLWLGTQTGLVKFDGVRFTVASEYELGGVSNRDLWVTHLLADRQDGLWIGTAQAGLIHLTSGTATRYGAQQGLPAGSIDCLFDDARGNIWACTPNGIAELTDGKIRVYDIEDGLPTLDVRAACVTRDGTLIAGISGEPQLAIWNGSRFTTRPLPVSKSAVVQSMLCGQDGVVWAGTSDGLIRSRDGKDERLTTANGLADNSILTLTESRDDGVLAGTTNGFSRIRGNDIDSFRPQDGLSQSTVYALFEDREGSLWAATKHGLNQFLDSRAIPYTESEGLPSNNTGPVIQDRRGVIWVGTLGDGLARFDGRAFSTLTTADGLTSNTIRSLAEDADGNLWVGTDAGLNRLRGGRLAGTWSTRNGLPDNHVRALFADQAGAIWIATARGAAVFRGGAIQTVADPRETPVDGILAFGQALGTDAVFAVPDDTPAFARADAMYRDREGLLWVGTLGAGLRMIDGEHIATFSVIDGLFDDVIYGIAEDDHGRLWMACSKGIFSVSREDLKQFAAGEAARIVSTPYSPLDALRTVECQPGVQPVVTRAADGRLWFSTIRGVLVIDPEHFDRKIAAPEVTVEDVIVDGERRTPGDLGPLSSGSKNVEFNYTATSFISPRSITFRYRLDGVDAAWIEAGARREAFYSNLAPGSFRFHVAACTPDGECNEKVNAVAFTILPLFYQRAWFLPLCVTFLALVGVGLYQLRIRRLKDQFDLVLAERGRIARELHDTLIQGFSGITMAMQAMVGRLPSSGERQTMEEIIRDAGSAMREARRSLMGLRSHDLASAGLATEIAQTVRQLTDASGVKLKLSLAECEVPRDVEYNLLRIAQEAVLNAVKHAGARTLRVTLNRTPTQLLLSIKDDGAGFDNEESAPAGHFGLLGMKERAAQIGARLQITSAPGQGTTVSVLMES